MKVYLAGKIDKHDWRSRVLSGPSNDDGGGYGEQAYQPWAQRQRNFTRPSTASVCTGPFFTDCDHGCAHAFSMHATMEYCGGPWSVEERDKLRSFVSEQCRLAIARSDLVFAYLNELTAYGTYAELGYARALHVPIVIALGPSLVEVELQETSALRQDENEVRKKRHNDELWLVKSFADHVLRGSSPEDAVFKALKRNG